MGNANSADKEKDGKPDNKAPSDGVDPADADQPPRTDSRSSSVESAPSRRRSVSSADGLKAGREANAADGFDPDDPLGGFDANASIDVDEPQLLGAQKLSAIKAALFDRLKDVPPDEKISIKALRLEQVRGVCVHLCWRHFSDAA